MSSPYGDAMNLAARGILISSFSAELRGDEDQDRDLVAHLAGMMFEDARSWVYAHDFSGRGKHTRIRGDRHEFLQMSKALYGNRSYDDLSTSQDGAAQFFRFTRDKKKILDFLKSLRRLQRGIPLAVQERDRVLAICELVQPLIRNLSSAAHFWEGQQDDDD